MKLSVFEGRASGWLGLLLFCGGVVSSHGMLVRTVADGETLIPGGVGMFRRLETPVYHAGQVAFVGSGSSSQTGVYLWEDGRLRVVADRKTPVPGSAELFRGFNRPTVENGTVWFVATTGANTNIQ